MFIQFPALFTNNLQQLVLTLNTILLIALLITTELVYAERDKSERQHLKQYYPIVAVLSVLLLLAIYQQIVKG